jgi:dTDP-4-amino-4,6-dideoxygalactose transaminase
MSELHAAVGLIHLSHLDDAIATRRRVAARYDEALAHLSGCQPLSIPAASVSNFYKYVVLLDPGIDRAELKRELSEGMGVSLSGEVYASPLHRQPIFADLVGDSFPVADDVCARHICLPVHSDMTDDEADYVVESLALALAGRTMEEAAK